MSAARAELLLSRVAKLSGVVESLAGSESDAIAFGGQDPRGTSERDPRASGVWPPPRIDPVPVKLPLPMPETEAVRTFGDYVLVLDG